METTDITNNGALQIIAQEAKGDSKEEAIDDNKFIVNTDIADENLDAEDEATLAMAKDPAAMAQLFNSAGSDELCVDDQGNVVPTSDTDALDESMQMDPEEEALLDENGDPIEDGASLTEGLDDDDDDDDDDPIELSGDSEDSSASSAGDLEGTSAGTSEGTSAGTSSSVVDDTDEGDLDESCHKK